MIPHSRPFIDPQDREEVDKALASGCLAQGEQVALFERDLCSFIGVRHGAAVSSGTAALHLALAALGTGPGDEVVVPSFVCSALLNAVHYTGAKAVPADIDPLTYNLDAVDTARRIGKKTKAIIVPHLFGTAADLDEVISLGVPVIEDCAQSVGSLYKERFTGSRGLISIFSFYATKVIATGEGGMAVSNDGGLMESIRDLREYDGKANYRIRFNYKMTDFQAAMGRSQLRKLPAFIERRREIAGRYNETLGKLGVAVPQTRPDRDHIYYRYVLPRPPETFLKAMQEMGVGCRKPVFKPLHGYLGLFGYPNTEAAWRKSVSVPIYPGLNENEIRTVTEAMKEACSRI